MRRREFIAALGGAAAWPVTARAQQPAQIQRVGVLMPGKNIPDVQDWVLTFEQQLNTLGWSNGRNLRVNYLWGENDPARLSQLATELISSSPDVILAFTTPSLVPLWKQTRTIPIVFTSVSDPVAQGFVASFARPGGDLTGFANFEPNMGAKWLQLLKEITPLATHVSVMFNPQTSPYNTLFLHSIETAAQSSSITVTAALLQNVDEIKPTFVRLGREVGIRIIVPPDTFTYTYSEQLRGGGGGPADTGNPWLGALEDAIDIDRRLPEIARRYRCCRMPSRHRGQSDEMYRRASDTDADKVWACNQSQDRQGAWPRCVPIATRPRRRGDRVKRRTFIAGLGSAAVWPVLARGQSQGKAAARVGVLLFGTPDTDQSFGSFREAFRDLGYIEARNVVYEHRYAEGKTERLRNLAIELAAIRPDVILATGGDVAPFARAATSTVPIVMIVSIDPVESGLVASLAHPGGNVAGVSRRLIWRANVCSLSSRWRPMSPISR